MYLDELKIGKSAKIINIRGNGRLRHRLLELGVLPNEIVSVVKKAPLGDPIEIRIRTYDISIRKEEARLIEIGEDDVSSISW